MKIRTGFVSNSSSSSFVLSTNIVDYEDDKVKVYIEMPINDLVEKVITNEEELKDYYENYIGVSVDEMLEATRYYHEELDDYQKRLDILNDGKILLCGECSNDESAFSGMIYNEGFDNLIVHNATVLDGGMW